MKKCLMKIWTACWPQELNWSDLDLILNPNPYLNPKSQTPSGSALPDVFSTYYPWSQISWLSGGVSELTTFSQCCLLILNFPIKKYNVVCIFLILSEMLTWKGLIEFEIKPVDVLRTISAITHRASFLQRKRERKQNYWQTKYKGGW